MRVLTLVKGLDRGGAESLLLVGARHRDPLAVTHEVAYLSARHHELVDDLEAEGLPVTCLAPRTVRDLRWLGRLRGAMARAQVVHAHSPVPAVAARLVARTLPRARRPKLVTTEHNVWDSHHPATRIAERLTFGLDDAHLAVSEAVRRSLPAGRRAAVEVVVAGVDLPAVRGQADRDAVRRELGVADHEILVGTIANLRPQKGYPDLLHAARTVLDTAPEARFVAIGRGPQEDEVAALHRALGLGDRFRLLGHRADAVRLLSGFDVFCLASHHEGLPVALMEALALGVPVVATRAGGIPELVIEGREGRLVAVGAVADLAAARLAEVGDDPGRKAHGEQAAVTGAGLTIESSVRHAEALYRALAGEHR